MHRGSPLAQPNPFKRKIKIDNVDVEENMSMFKQIRLLERRYALNHLGGLIPARSWDEDGLTGYLEFPVWKSLMTAESIIGARSSLLGI